MTATIGQIRAELRAEIMATGDRHECWDLRGTGYNSLIEECDDHGCWDAEECREAGYKQSFDPAQVPPFSWAGGAA